jgi:hypothetical protein
MFSKNNEISNFMKFRPVGYELFHADGRTERRTDVFRGFVNVRKLLLSALSSFSTVGRYLQIKERTSRLMNYESVIGCE